MFYYLHFWLPKNIVTWHPWGRGSEVGRVYPPPLGVIEFANKSLLVMVCAPPHHV